MREFPTFREILLEQLQDVKFARIYIAVALEEYEKDKDTQAFLRALRDVATAQGGLTQLAAKTKLNRQHLYRILSPKGNPTLGTIGLILRGLGFRFSIEVLGPKSKEAIKYKKTGA